MQNSQRLLFKTKTDSRKGTVRNLVNIKVLAIAGLAIAFISLGGVRLIEPATQSLRNTIQELKQGIGDRVEERKRDTQSKSTGGVKPAG
jgi:hypothetical protein